MSTVDTIAIGTFCWPELSTNDQKRATAFYSQLFGWDVEESPMGPGETYSMFRLHGKAAGAAYTMRAEEKQAGAPANWHAYVAVQNADEAVKKAESLGGRVLAPAFDVMDAGRMAVIQDPTGAIFHVWQAGKHAGIEVQGEPGSLCWTELSTRDTKGAEKFYTQLFGWTAKHSQSPGMEYTEFSVNGTPSIGMMQMPAMVPEQVPAFWMPYFQVADVDASTSKATTLGASTAVQPTDIPGTGRFAVISDPTGAHVALFTPAHK